MQRACSNQMKNEEKMFELPKKYCQWLQHVGALHHRLGPGFP